MEIPDLHSWPRSAEEAIQVQSALCRLVDLRDGLTAPMRTVAGIDVAYEGSSSRIAGAVVVMDVGSFEVIEQRVVIAESKFPYLPGLFAFRELPSLLDALRQVSVTPDLLICDGHGVAHPRHFGLACHVGILTGIPSIGAAKNVLVGDFPTPDVERGAQTPLVYAGEVVGAALRTRTGVKPIFVSPGHRICLDTSTRHVLNLSPRFRIPEPIRLADHVARLALKQQQKE